MPRITSPFRRHSDSWFVNTIIGKPDSASRPPPQPPPQFIPNGKDHTQTIPCSSGSENNENVNSSPTSCGGIGSGNADDKPSDINHPQFSSSFLQLLRLLLWKNYKLLVRNKLSTIAELLLPLLFTLLIVAIRFFGAETKRFDNATIFEPFEPSVIPGTIKTCCNQIFYTPDVPVIRRLMEEVQKNHFNLNGLRYSFTGFGTEEALLRAYTNSSSGMFAETDDGVLSSTVLAGVVFTSEIIENGTQFEDEIEYSLRFPAALRSQSGLLGERFTFGMKQAWFTEILYPIIQTFGPRAKDQPTGGEPGYWTEGFLYLQQAIEKELLSFLTTPQNVTSVLLQRFPYPPFVEDEFFVVLQPFLPLTLILSFLYTVTSISKTLVTEKERRIHESMKMMGLTNALHWTAWFLTFLALFAVSIFMITVLLKIHINPDASKPSGLAVLPKSDPTLIYFCLLVHGFQLISFCFFISSIFKTANAAAITSSVLWFMLFLPFPFLQPRYSILSSRVKIMWSLMTNMGICFCCQVFCMFEGTSEGAQWNRMFQGVTPDDTFSIGDCICVMFFNGLVYFLSAMYVSVVWPGEFGVGRKWYFLFEKQFWCGGRSSNKVSNGNILQGAKTVDEKLPDFYERSPKSLVPGIQVQSLRKSFGDIIAINRMNLTMYQNETFCLLGKNGAGKSTLVSILTGLYSPSDGTVFVNRQDILINLKMIRKSLGVCPQHNVLFDELNVQEHLVFFASLKGMRGKLMNEEVNRMIMAIGLGHKRKAEVRTLSGGMKRRLCVGIAFCGGSEVVILDEPSSGLDVEARRAIWDLIELEKVGRTVLLTTHFMEEAELLADRIAVIVNGNVRCCGSPLFLNKKYNGGYNLTLVMEHEGSHILPRMTEFIHHYLPESCLIRSAGKELTYALPESKSNEFHILFDAIEKQQKELGIETFGARLTSMEDIFIRVNAIDDEQRGLSPTSKSESTEITFSNGEKLNTDFLTLPQPEPQRNKSGTLLFQQFCAMIVKKVICVGRRRGLLIGQTFIPMAYLSLVLIVLQTIPGIFDPPPHILQLDHYELFGRTVTPLQCTSNLNTSSTCPSFVKYLENLHKLKEVLPLNDSFTDQILEKENANIPAFNSKYIIGFEESMNETSKTLIAFFNNQPLHTPPLALNMLTNALLLDGAANHTVRVTNHPFPYTNLDTQDTGTYWTVGFHVGYNTAFALTFVVAVFATFLVKEEVTGAAQLQRISGLNPAVYWVSNFIVDFGAYVFPCIGLLVIFAVFAGSTDFLSWSLQGYLLLLFLAFGWALIPLVYVMSQFFTIPAVGFAGCGVACAFSGFLTILTVTVLELPQVNQIGLALLLHRIFLIFPTYALGRGITQMSINKKLSEKCSGFNLEFLCDSAPDSYCCVKLQTNFMDWNEVGIGKNLTYMIAVGILSMLTIALIETGIFARLKSSLVNLQHHSYLVKSFVGANLRSESQLDENVRQEWERVGKCEPNSGEDFDALLVKDLTKSYGPVMAVESLSFGIKMGQCFGLLGTNGAGKTSTFKMLVGEILADSGEAFICSHSILKNRRKTHKLIGYCPQFDALLCELTGREILVMFARLRGVKENEIGKLVDDLAKELVFEQYLDRLVDGYSGGNKRKLSTAVAFIGTPKVVFLDEPTAGMDPLARRHVWSAINSRVKDKRTCVLLTSHSLEECEILCTRIAIMKNGRMQCLGSPQQLKHKYGDGFSLVIQIKGSHLGSGGESKKEQLQRKLSSLSQISSTSTVSSVDTSHSMQLVDNYLRAQFPPNSQWILTSSHANYLHYHIKQTRRSRESEDDCEDPDDVISWSILFRTMENLKEQAGISAYSISQISLEQVFLSV